MLKPFTKNAVILFEEPNDFQSRPISYTGPANWIGWERVEFVVTNPMGGSVKDTLTFFSVPADGTLVAGGLEYIILKAGACIIVNLDNYFYDADTPDYDMTWTVSGNDSISVDINQITHAATICALSET